MWEEGGGDVQLQERVSEIKLRVIIERRENLIGGRKRRRRGMRRTMRMKEEN